MLLLTERRGCCLPLPLSPPSFPRLCTPSQDLQFIQQRKAKQKDWEHELKLESPQYCYHVRRWTAANTIQRAARQYFLEWTKTHKWRPRVTLHPEMLAKEFRDYVHNPGAW